MHLFLIRHAQSYVNLEDWDQGYIDTGLTELGQRQAARVADWVATHLHVDALYASTMARTLETARQLERTLGKTARTDDRLREFGNCYGDGSPVPSAAMPIAYPEWWGTERPNTPISAGGESWMLFRVRVAGFMDELVARHAVGRGNPPSTVVVVCHGGVIEVAFDHLFNLGPRRPVEILTHNTGIVHWEYRPSPAPGREEWRLHAHGLINHLFDEDGTWHGSRSLLRGATPPTHAPRPARSQLD